MKNSDIADELSLLSKMLDLHNQDAELAKSLSNAAFQIDRYTSEMSTMPRNNIYQLRGITNAIADFIFELLDTNTLKILQHWLQNTPDGILQMMQIKGLGPKKLRIVWKEMNIENPSELLYACNENRLIAYKGFGEKLQQSILEATEFYLNSNGKYLYAKVKYFSEQLLLYFTQLKKWQVSLTGDIRRQSNIIEFVEYVIVGKAESIASNHLNNFENLHVDKKENGIRVTIRGTVKTGKNEGKKVVVASQTFKAGSGPHKGTAGVFKLG
jgi:DNA polymerase (family 10)